MKHYKNFSKYAPVSPLPEGFPMENLRDPNIEYLAFRHDLSEMYLGEDKYGPLFEQDEDGNCWYDLNKTFSKDTYKIVYNSETGLVNAFSKEADGVFPHGGSVIEIKSIPDGFETLYWKINPETLEIEEDKDRLYEYNRRTRLKLLQAATPFITTLTLMKENKDTKLSSSESDLLDSLTEYVAVVFRTRLDVNEPTWPDSPI